MLKFSGIVMGAGMLGLLTVSTASAARAQDVKTVVAKTNAVYKNLKTLQVTYELQVSAGANGSGIVHADVKMITGQKLSIDTHAVAGGTGKVGKEAGGANQRIVDDGATVYIYIPKLNQYVKQPHNAQVYQGVIGLYNLPNPTDTASGAYKLLPPAKIDGKPVYVLEYAPAQAKGKAAIQFSIDQASYHLKAMKIISNDPKQKGVRTTLVKTEVLNASIPNSAFVFTPPKGATELKAPRQQPSPLGGR